MAELPGLRTADWNNQNSSVLPVGQRAAAELGPGHVEPRASPTAWHGPVPGQSRGRRCQELFGPEPMAPCARFVDKRLAVAMAPPGNKKQLI